MKTRTVLFICTGNYYRSRFAELLFNSLALPLDSGWRAASRGVATELSLGNIGPISSYALEGLKARGIRVERNIRFPIQLKERDLAEADLIIVLDEDEHRPYLESRFPGWADRVIYWHVSDLDLTPADEAIPEIERQVRSLVRSLDHSGVPPNTES